LQTSSEDSVALGFMTYNENGILARFQSQSGAEYIEIRLVRNIIYIYIGYLINDYVI